jgi:hypothetical protein
MPIETQITTDSHLQEQKILQKHSIVRYISTISVSQTLKVWYAISIVEQ